MSNKSKKGWIKLYRKIQEWEWYNSPNTFRVFFHLLINASHEKTVFKGISIEAGEFATRSTELQKELRLTRQQVRTALDNLKTTNEITTRTTKRYMVVTLCKFDSYNGSEKSNNHTNNHINNHIKTIENLQPQNQPFNNHKNNHIDNHIKGCVNSTETASYEGFGNDSNHINNHTSNQKTNHSATIPTEKKKRNKEVVVVEKNKKEKKFDFEIQQIQAWQSQFVEINIIKEIALLNEKNSAANITNPKRYAETVFARKIEQFQIQKNNQAEKSKNEQSNNRNSSSRKNGKRKKVNSFDAHRPQQQFGVSQNFEGILRQTSETVPGAVGTISPDLFRT